MIIESDVTTRLSIALFDEDHVRYPIAELRLWINDGQREIANMKVDATSRIASYKLSPGVRQTLPADGIRLLDIVRNLGADGLTPGENIMICEQETLGMYNPSWFSDPATGSIHNFCYDERVPEEFLVYPQADDSTYVELVYAGLPVDTTAPTDPIGVNDWYGNALFHYCMYRACMKDAETGINTPAAVTHYQAFKESLTGRGLSDLHTTPNVANNGGEVPRMARIGV